MHRLIDINNFTDPIKKTAIDEPADITKHIAAELAPERDAECDKEDTKQSKMKISETFDVLQQL